MKIIELQDEEAAALTAKATAAGLTLEAWLKQLAGTEVQPPTRPARHIAAEILENMRDVSPEVMAKMPKDGASQHDHYIYGWPKREV